MANGTEERFSIPLESARSIMEQLLGMQGLVLSLETNTGIYSNTPIPLWNPIVVDDFIPLLFSDKVFKILVSSQNKEIYDRIGEFMTDETYYTLAKNELIQIMSRKATKRNAVEVVLRDLGISRKEVIYFGDDNDDIECIKWCGCGVAVSNVIKPVLEAADCVIGSNDEDGIAEYIRKMLE